MATGQTSDSFQTPCARTIFHQERSSLLPRRRPPNAFSVNEGHTRSLASHSTLNVEYSVDCLISYRCHESRQLRLCSVESCWIGTLLSDCAPNDIPDHNPMSRKGQQRQPSLQPRRHAVPDLAGDGFGRPSRSHDGKRSVHRPRFAVQLGTGTHLRTPGGSAMQAPPPLMCRFARNCGPPPAVTGIWRMARRFHVSAAHAEAVRATPKSRLHAAAPQAFWSQLGSSLGFCLPPSVSRPFPGT
jgi:hypothetical protein